ncbi:MAG TPA: hypoxanthine phosphoribosyltransferase [Peptococcaceae bacterium]|nr:hypoxanthine phosphoribosyltransferase [Peptococcaceae bacterium]
MGGSISKILFTEEQIKNRIKEIGMQITEDYKGENLTVIGILKGAFIFAADLVRQIKLPVTVDFIAVSSYGSATQSSGEVKIIKDLDISVKDKNLLLVEDIVDTGLTLKYLLENLKSRGPAGIKTCVLLDKPQARKVEVPINYKGFTIDNVFVVGYGLDYDQKFRNLPYIACLKKEVVGKSRE